ncbi:ABC transporter substrate-binding protein [Nakamurella antarctica]|uniref:ABC transporter substrate-binding protein n=1 Tax=Nakamurella antarctica TaxID=1902245 RepID=A0A3G8ZSR2_9ACTN|nr:ABC transporter substrate-binding protein [Nakamurella antarctica]AZI57116.1 ABC transporter substrate-binding protein [Nakamurella antarctica]
MKLYRLLSAATVATLAVSLSSCASSQRDSASSGNTTAASPEASSSAAPSSDAGSSEAPSASSSASSDGGAGDGTFIFGSAGAPSMFDPLYATDGQTFIVTRQMTEGLLGFKPGTTESEPALAESWTSTPDGLSWTFKIRQGVTFSDGEKLDAEAVCYNIERMYTQTGAGATQAQYWSDTLGGFKDQKAEDGTAIPSLYKSCSASDPATVVIDLNSFTSKFPSILGLPAFSIQSPKALKQYNANDVKAEGDSFSYPEYALKHPTGTGPFTFTKYDSANQTVELTRNENYWGEKAKSKTLIFKIIADEAARKQEFDAGTIDGYDTPSSGDWDALTAAGAQVLVRPAFNILYLGFNPTNNPALKDLKVRQALSYALNRPDFVSSQLPNGAKVALNFYPDTIEGWTPDVEKYEYDPAKAKALLKEAGQEALTVNFWWPTEVTRPYMPNPSAVFQAFKADLEAVGVKVNETSKPWNGGYLDGVEAQSADLFLLGWTGDYATPDNFIGTFFTKAKNRFGTADYPWGTTLSNELIAADAEADTPKRVAMYADIDKKLMSDYLPALPISHSPPALVVAGNVKGMVASPLTDEHFSTVYKTS